MSGLCGWLGFGNDREGNITLVSKMASHITRSEASELITIAGSTCALCISQVGGGASVYQDKEVMVAINGLHYWDDKELAEIAKLNGSAKALAQGYQYKGIDVLNLIKGAFSLALILETNKEVLIATDRIGMEPLCYSFINNCFIFASNASTICQHPESNCRLDPQAIFNYLYFHVIPSPKSIYSHQRRLLPASYVKLQEGQVTSGTYWEIVFQETSQTDSFDDLAAEFRDLLGSNVQRLSSSNKVGAFLSGGTDSSTITGLLCDTLRAPAPTYSIGFEAKGYDEMEYARIAANHFNTDHHEYYVSPEDILDAIPMIVEVYSEPFGNSSAIPAYYCALMAKNDGVTRLLAGDGGDEIFAGNERYAKQQIFAIYERIPKGVREKFIEPFINSPLFSDAVTPLRKLRSYVEQAKMPMPARMETYNLLERIGTNQVLSQEFIQQVDISEPISHLTEHYSRVRANTLLNKMLGLDLKITLADNDLPKVSKMCERAGVEVAYPFLSDELIEFSAQLPPALKLKGTKLRYFFKEALRDFLPPQILVKQKHGFGLPFGPWVVNHKRLGEMAKDNLSDLKSRHIVRADFIDKLLDTYLLDHANYYGGMVWLLLILEQWFKKHVD